MLRLGEAVFLEGIDKITEYGLLESHFVFRRVERVTKKRIAVVELANGLELILKAVLVKKGYCVNDLKPGIYKMTDKVGDIMNPKRSKDISVIIDFLKSEYPNLREDLDNIDELRLRRNEIVHSGVGIGDKKRVYFISAISCLTKIYAIEGIGHKRFLERISTAVARF